MNKHHKFRKILANVISIIVVLAMAFSGTGSASAAGTRTFVGIWRAIDNFDGSLVRVTITGSARGLFLITWTESYFSFCDGRAGIAVGKGHLNPDDPYVLEADMRLKCLRTGDTTEWHQVWKYKPVYDVLASYGDYRVETIFTRLGRALVAGMDLRANYGHDWVESFYEAGHTVLVTVTEADGVTAKATIEVQTEPKDYWGGEAGFQSLDGVWDPATPDIQPGDWVIAQVDNGASAQVQIGDINGMIDLNADSIEGKIMASWFTDPVQVECLDWGSGQEPPFDNQDGGFTLTNGEDPFACSWEEWDIGPYQNVGVGYFGHDGHWVANAFFARNPRIVVSEAGNWFWTTEFNPGMLDIFIYESADEGAVLLWSGQSEADQSGFTIVGYDVHAQDLVPGNYLVVSDGVNEKGVVLEMITMEVFDTENEIMAGSAPAGRDVTVVAGMAEAETQATINLTAHPESGAWWADFSTIPFDITEDMRPWSFAQIFDEDGDANEAGTPPPHPTSVIFTHPAYELIEGNNWLPGTVVILQVDDPANGEGTDYSDNQIVGDDTWLHFWLADFDLQAGHVITMTDGQYTQAMVVSKLRVTGFDLDAHTVFGAGDPNSEFFIADNGMPVSVDGAGNWSATFDALTPGSWWTIIQRYADGNEMRETFRAPMPMMIAWKNWDDVAGSEWTPGAEVTLTIDDPSNGQGVDYTFTEFAVDSGNLYYGNVYFNLGIEVQTGYVLTMNDGNFTKTLVISALTVTGFDFDNRIIYGTGDPGAQLLVHINGLDSSWTAVGDDHNWSVYHELLEPGVWLDAIQPDDDGDHTRDGGQAL